MEKLSSLQKALRSLQNAEKAKHLQRFFKTQPGQYGVGDCFLGITVPQQRQLVKQQGLHASYLELQQLMASVWHEERLTALLILVERYRRASSQQDKQAIYDFYVANWKGINNWDLVDLSAPGIVGQHLYYGDHSILTQWAQSERLWTRRIAMVATYYFIRQNEFKAALTIAALLLQDKEDLIHKAVGWMLREVGKRDLASEEVFLRQHYTDMPRTMLRYAIERFEEPKRQQYLKGLI